MSALIRSILVETIYPIGAEPGKWEIIAKSSETDDPELEHIMWLHDELWEYNGLCDIFAHRTKIVQVNIPSWLIPEGRVPLCKAVPVEGGYDEDIPF